MDADGDVLCWSIGGTTAGDLAQSFPFLTQPIRLRKCDVVRAIEPKALGGASARPATGTSSTARTTTTGAPRQRRRAA